MSECKYCQDPEKRAVTIFRQRAGEKHKVQAILDASPDTAGVTFNVLRLAGSATGRTRQYLTGFAVNYCPFCGRKLRDDEHFIKEEEKK